MNIQNRVFKKLAEVEKVELATQKVELGLIDDVKKVASDLESEWKKVLSIAVDGAKALNNKVLSKTKPINEKIFDLKDKIEKAEQALKDLGIGKNSDILKAKQALKIAQGQSNELSAISRRLNSVY